MTITSVTALLGLCTPGLVISEIRKLVADRGRCTLAELGDHLRVAGVALPDDTILSDLVLQHPDEFRLSGPPNNRKVSLLAQTTERALLDTVRAVLRTHGPMTSAELRLRLREQRSAIPGLMSLLQRHGGEFVVRDGAVRLMAAPTPDSKAAAGEAMDLPLPAPLVRMHSLALPTTMDGLAPAARVREVVFIDLDNQAFTLERVACSAVQASDVLLLAFCARLHNPRLSQATADSMQLLAERGMLRLLRPERDGPNAADFVLAFWAGWLHARLPAEVSFVLLSADSALEQTVGDALSGLQRQVTRDPSCGSLKVR
jgi:hypothetical protein